MKAFKNLKSHHKIVFSIIIGFAVISFWRGIWGLLDEYLFPSNIGLSLWTSVVVGILILIVTGYVMKELT
jgi:hypothetical protein